MANDHAQHAHTQSLKGQANAYHITNSSSNSFTTNFVIPKSALWDFRLGKVSFKRINKISQMYTSFDFYHNPTCYICHMAKHKKLPYPISYSIASNNFDLLDFDIWGPLVIPSIHNHKYFRSL